MLYVFGEFEEYYPGAAEEEHLSEIWEQVTAHRKGWA